MLTGNCGRKSTMSGMRSGRGGIANPIEVIEQITYILFLRGLDDAHTREENRANRLHRPMEQLLPRGKGCTA